MIIASRQTKRFLLVFLVFIFLSVGATYYRTVIVHDYDIYVELDCDPEVESCFTYYCDPQWEECSGIPEEDTWYYMVLRKDGAALSVACDPNVDECEDIVCDTGDTTCEMIYCDPLIDGECNAPPLGSEVNI